jgi:hypothetical protein
MSSKMLIRHFTTKKPDPKPDKKPDYEPLIVGILISLAAGQFLKFIEYKSKFAEKK